MPIWHGFGVWRLDAEWIISPTGRRILAQWLDHRPGWLWSADGERLIWHNPAARFFNGKLKKTGLRLSAEAVPIRGQVSRLIRLGSVGRSSLSRVQLLAGGRPLSETCSCTPLRLPDGDLALLVIGIEAIDDDVIAAAGGLTADAMTESLLPPGTDYMIVSDGRAVGASRNQHNRTTSLDPAQLPADGEGVMRIRASPHGAELVLLAPGSRPASIADIRADEGMGNEHDLDLADTPEPLLPMGLSPIAETPPDDTAPHDHWVEPMTHPATGDRALSSLFDRLADDAGLYTPLTPDDEVFTALPAAETEATAPPEASPESLPEQVSPPAPPAPSAQPETPQPDLIAAVIEYADDPEDTGAPAAAEAPRSHWMITGRGFRALTPAVAATTDASEPRAGGAEPIAPAADATADDGDMPTAAAEAAPDAEAVDRVSRYNFEELGRILTDRVSAEPARDDAPGPLQARSASPEGIINLSAETLVLNRLPLAILVFRDQQVLFANRALTDLLGYDSVEALRSAGIASIFPASEEAGAGPVNRLMRRDGSPLPVNARLQSVSWQGRAALMLSASLADPVHGHEGAVRAFAEIAAEAREDGFLVADRAGVVTQLSAHGTVIFGRPASDVLGKPLAILVSKADMEPLRAFLEKPARFAETARPRLVAAGEDGNSAIVLFAEGQAGIVTGYFGFVSKRHAPSAPATPDDDLDPSMLGRLSRGIRRPLNSIIGFADIMRTAAPGALDAARATEYARDIRTAGLEIAVLVDELEDFTRLRDGRYAPRPSDVDLAGLLESCMARVRTQAGTSRVLVRSAISTQLPRIRADRASLGQALLNLLASAIDQTPVGGSVILSAQADDDGCIAIHVRDGAENTADLGDRFVVFRDGVDREGEVLGPVRSSVGLALTRSLLAVNACSLSVDPTAGVGTLFSLQIPAELIVKQ